MKLTLVNPITIEGSSKEIAELMHYLSAIDELKNFEKLKAEIAKIERSDVE